jgi:hypothetical protein
MHKESVIDDVTAAMIALRYAETAIPMPFERLAV